MQKEDLEKMIRIADSIRSLSALTVKVPSDDDRVSGTEERYKAYYELLKPLIGRYSEYQLEFGSLPKTDEHFYGAITSAFISLSSFIDAIIRQETLNSRTAVDQIKKEFFIEDNMPFTAYKTVSDIVSKAATSLKIVDNYLESKSLDFFYGVNTQIPINTLTKVLKPNSSVFKIALAKFLNEWGGTALEVKTTNYFHDRFIIIDDIEVWHLGPSLNAFGLNPAMISNIQDSEIAKTIINIFNREWGNANPI